MSAASFQIRIRDRGRTLVEIDRFHIPEQKITLLFGESGIGKTLLAKAVYGLLNPALFDITINGEAYATYLQHPRRRALERNSFFVFQEPSSHLNPLLSLGAQLREGALARSEDETAILERLWQYGKKEELPRLLNTFPKPYRPSGGEKQRILIAMAFKKMSLRRTQPTFFVFDEPTGNLDNTYRNLILAETLRYFKEQPFTLLFITHDYSLLRELYERHRPLLPFMEFKELVRTENRQVRQQSFSAASYLNWEEQLQPLKTAFAAQPEPVLTIEPEIRVFGRSLVLHRNPQSKQPEALRAFPGTFTYIKAPSGVGKTSVAKILMGLIRAERFKAALGTHTITEATSRAYFKKHIWGREAAMVFQHADESLNRQATVWQTFAALPLKSKLNRKVLFEALKPVFPEMNAVSFLNQRLDALSGGQKQRINLMRSLLLNTRLIILDEPLNGLDFESIRRILSVLNEKQKQGAAFLIISHNDAVFERLTNPGQIYYLEQRTP